MRKPSVKPVTRLVRLLSYPCNNNVKTLGFTGVGNTCVLVVDVGWVTVLLAPMEKPGCFGGGGFVVSSVVSKIGFADQLAMTFLLAEGTSVCVVAIPLRTSTLVEVIAEARGWGRVLLVT